jgi:hypothetical protein
MQFLRKKQKQTELKTLNTFLRVKMIFFDPKNGVNRNICLTYRSRRKLSVAA